MRLGQVLAHAAVGAGTGAIRGDAAAGAVGGAAGTAASLAYEALTEGGMLADLTALGEGAPDGPLSPAQVAMFDRWREAGVTVSALAGVAAAAASGTSVAVAQGAAENAAENNVLPAVVLVVRGAVIAYTLYEAYETATSALDTIEAYRRGEIGPEEVAEQLALVGIEIAVGAVASRADLAKKLASAAGDTIRRVGLGDRLDAALRRLDADERVASVSDGSNGGGTGTGDSTGSGSTTGGGAGKGTEGDGGNGDGSSGGSNRAANDNDPVINRTGNGASFADRERLADHYNRHGADFGAKSEAEYQQMADNFLTGPRNSTTLEITRSNGDVVRYDPASDAFGVVSSNGSIRTYYVPDPGVHGYPTNLDYFNAQQR